jgi:NADP-dependent alcohol dehydrogenase
VLDFEFYNPTRIVFGKGTISRLRCFSTFGCPRPGVVRRGKRPQERKLAEVKAALGRREVQEFGGIESPIPRMRP